MKKYSEQLERYEQAAYAGKFGADWLEEVGEGVKFYAMMCEAQGKRPTFAGLMKYLDDKASIAQKGGNPANDKILEDYTE